ncbi:F0F1 ATP synthase subunit gamma [Anaerobium acetethylicum]|uniref:F-type H+-transporting ATPase subunit gamma n=1 Tax=Anaerobium acetethylicum TaxID=1619234 RepID=A0A1D3TR52_9FIRM|nr:FoF1 ATP synthase subunit gamma [Anaerobium acetethylicum]SCP96149.1 F-type H+-transporting ATPase subunit gamma [Anaerobium acetethylicum]
MQNLQSLRKSISSAESLQSIVGIMKAHASSNILQYEHAAKASMKYRSILDMALYIVLSEDSEYISVSEDGDGFTLHIVFGSDYGLAGNFNERMISFAKKSIPKDEKHLVIVIGQKILNRLEDDYTISGSFSVPQTEAGIIPIVQRLLLKIDQLRDTVPISRILLYYCKPLDNYALEEEIGILFPIDIDSFSRKKTAWESNTIPTYLMDRDTLFSDLLKQYFFLTIYRSFCYSLVSENTSRITSMDSAKKNIEERLQLLHSMYNKERQTNTTEEINDVISGFKSIRNKKRNL